MLLALRSTSCAAASENAIRELVGLAMSNPSELVHGRDMALPRSCCYWPYGQGEAATRGYDFREGQGDVGLNFTADVRFSCTARCVHGQTAEPSAGRRFASRYPPSLAAPASTASSRRSCPPMKN